MGLRVSPRIGEKVVDEVYLERCMDEAHLERCMEHVNPFKEGYIEGARGLNVCLRSNYLTHTFYDFLWCSCM